MSSRLFDSSVPSDTRAEADLGEGHRVPPAFFGQKKIAEERNAGRASKKCSPPPPTSWLGSATARVKRKMSSHLFSVKKVKSCLLVHLVL